MNALLAHGVPAAVVGARTWAASSVQCQAGVHYRAFAVTTSLPPLLPATALLAFSHYSQNCVLLLLIAYYSYSRLWTLAITLAR